MWYEIDLEVLKAKMKGLYYRSMLEVMTDGLKANFDMMVMERLLHQFIVMQADLVCHLRFFAPKAIKNLSFANLFDDGSRLLGMRGFFLV